MEDLEVREWIAYAILASLVVAAGIGVLIQRRRAYWRRERMAGSSAAKRRELERRR